MRKSEIQLLGVRLQSRFGLLQSWSPQVLSCSAVCEEHQSAHRIPLPSWRSQQCFSPMLWKSGASWLEAARQKYRGICYLPIVDGCLCSLFCMVCVLPSWQHPSFTRVQLGSALLGVSPVKEQAVLFITSSKCNSQPILSHVQKCKTGILLFSSNWQS